MRKAQWDGLLDRTAGNAFLLYRHLGLPPTSYWVYFTRGQHSQWIIYSIRAFETTLQHSFSECRRSTDFLVAGRYRAIQPARTSLYHPSAAVPITWEAKRPEIHAATRGLLSAHAARGTQARR